jgi:hypothetical protein
VNFGEQQSLRLFVRALTHVCLEIPSTGQRFGTMHSFSAGEALKKAGGIGRDLAIILCDRIETIQRDRSGRQTPVGPTRVVSCSPGEFTRELAIVRTFTWIQPIVGSR